MEISGILGKLETKADWATYLLSAYESIPTYGGIPGKFKGISGMLHWFLDPKYGALNEIKNTLTWPGLLEYKLFESPHLYTAAFKIGALGWLAGEAGFFTKYQNLFGKLVKAGFIGALTLPGSGEEFRPASYGGSPSSAATGNGM